MHSLIWGPGNHDYLILFKELKYIDRAKFQICHAFQHFGMMLLKHRNPLYLLGLKVGISIML